MRSTPRRALIITSDAYPHSTRARKAAITLAASGWRVEYVGMSKPGRTGRWTDPGSSVVDGVEVTHVKMRAPNTEPTAAAIATNLTRSYMPALFRMARRAVSRDFDLVIAVSAPMIPLGIMAYFKSRPTINFDITERPGAVSTRGSGATLISKIERPLLRLAAAITPNATVVVPPDVIEAKRLGFSNARLLLNAPLASWRADFRPPTDGPLTFVIVGSIFEGRGFEMLIKAAALASADSEFTIDVYGTGRPEYIDSLIELTNLSGVNHRINWHGPVESTKVSEIYLSHHVGLVLYESNDLGNDGLSNKLMECVSSGRPVLAGDLPQNRDFVSKNGAGWTCGMTVADLASGIEKVASEATLLPILSKRCRSLGDDYLTWETAFHRIVQSFE